MSDFDRRRNAFEAKFAVDQETAFKAKAKAHRALGRWAAGLLGRDGEAAEAYAGNVVIAGIASKDDAALGMVVADLEASGVGGRAEAQARLASAFDEIESLGAEAAKAV